MSVTFDPDSDPLVTSLSRAAASPFDVDPSVEHVNTPLWLESRWPAEWLRLRMSPVYFGYGVPHGNGEPVLLVPGFLAGDWMMLELKRWLKRIGYTPHLANIHWNTDCPDLTAKRLEKRTRAIYEKSGHKVRLIGHSLGGMLSKYVVQESPDVVDRVITLGSPFKNLVKAHPAVVGIWDKLKLKQSRVVGRNLKPSCGTGHCTCGFVRNMIQPKSVGTPQFAVYSTKDGVADWSSCVEDDPACNTEVTCTHIGMIVEASVYRAVGERLAQAVVK